MRNEPGTKCKASSMVKVLWRPWHVHGVLKDVGPGQVEQVRLPGKGNSNSHGARPDHLFITMIKWIRTRRLSIKNSLPQMWATHRSYRRKCRRDMRGLSTDTVALGGEVRIHPGNSGISGRNGVQHVA